MFKLDWLSFERNADTLGGRIRELTAEIEQKKQKRDEILDLPYSREEVVKIHHEYIDKRATWRGNILLRDAEKFKRLPLDVDSVAPILESNGGHSVNGVVHPDAMYSLFSNSIKEHVEQTFMSEPWPEKVGPPRAEREGITAQINKEIEKLETELAALKQKAQKILQSVK